MLTKLGIERRRAVASSPALDDYGFSGFQRFIRSCYAHSMENEKGDSFVGDMSRRKIQGQTEMERIVRLLKVDPLATGPRARYADLLQEAGSTERARLHRMMSAGAAWFCGGKVANSVMDAARDLCGTTITLGAVPALEQPEALNTPNTYRGVTLEANCEIAMHEFLFWCVEQYDVEDSSVGILLKRNWLKGVAARRELDQFRETLAAERDALWKEVEKREAEMDSANKGLSYAEMDFSGSVEMLEIRDRAWNVEAMHAAMTPQLTASDMETMIRYVTHGGRRREIFPEHQLIEMLVNQCEWSEAR